MKTYSNKSNAIRAAVSQGYSKDGIHLHQDAAGRWSFEPADNALDAELTEIYGTPTCPGCGIGLDNGVLDYQNVRDTKGREVADKTTYEFECMACGHEFGPEAPKQPAKPEPKKKEGSTYTRTGQYSDAYSEREKPVHYVHRRLNEITDGGRNMDALPARKDLVALLREEGINRNTAATQFQRWLDARKG